MTSNEEGKEIVPFSSSLVQVKIGNREYPMVQSTRCGVCMHPGRFAIEEKLMLNFGYPAITRFISDQQVQADDGSVTTWPALTTTQLRNHRQAGHIAANGEIAEELRRRRAEAAGFDLETSHSQLVDHVIINDVILQQGYEALIKGEIKPDVKDINAAIKLRADLESANHQNESIEQYQDLMVMMLRTLQATVDETTFKGYLSKISAHPTFKTIQQRRTIEG